MKSIRRVIYISQATYPIGEQELEQLVEIASHNNKRDGITGALLYVENSFIQVLEGEDTAITRLLATIESDPRHKNLRVIADETNDFRHFSGWSMGYVEPPSADKSAIVSEVRRTRVAERESSAIEMPLPHTFAMMQNLYKTDRALQRARV